MELNDYENKELAHDANMHKNKKHKNKFGYNKPPKVIPDGR